ncbi:YbhB/YbcL family Raf kinase inhibitor-like protein [Neisseria chenwenguii]|uniref:Phosphatidylethanolamine-binding protein n=1 Tax=Neisseria chenwenguii TaxID=1853278 RepID=A0A220S4N0_9NEIS|nr:YbhB/YbcL family Raf kinase inhibitor-like protein [Neisseria chenwenguii]ASK28155.1 phosphatidylethanolamine-binding protein [Neisseria chenwenguii]ROV57307.1 YbhB/YbcL family Raf kinase inhibitor-like protein [Neisseria chenwenguii]
MKKLLALGLLAASTAALAQGKFSLSVDNLAKNGKFKKEQVLSAPYGFGCDGGNQSPALSWKNPPKGTKSFVLTVHDKDAPTGLGWMHWVVANIPADARSLPANIGAKDENLPKGALQTRTDFGVPGYGGACPPKGEVHRYEFKLTALKVDKLPNVGADATPALVGFFTKANALGEAKFVVKTGRYSEIK